MEELRKSIEKLLIKKKKDSKRKESSRPKIKNTCSQYVSTSAPKTEVRLRSHNYLKTHYKEQENMRLFNKLKQIRARDTVNDRSPKEQKMINEVYELNIASRRLQRRSREKKLQLKNNQFIERIVHIKTHHSPIMSEPSSTDHSRQRKHSSKSGLLPPIMDPYSY